MVEAISQIGSHTPQNTMTGTVGCEGDPYLNTFSGGAATVYWEQATERLAGGPSLSPSFQ